MAEVKKIATRESYGNALAELGKEYPNLVVLDADLAAATKTGIFKKAFPDRHIDCGILSGTNSTMSPILQSRQTQIFLRASIDTSSPFLSLVIVLEERPDAL